MTTAIIGTGGIGSAIARQLASGGEALQLSSADKQSAQRLAAEIGGTAVVAVDNRSALQGADAVILALRFSVLKDVIDEIADPLGGKSLVVPSNPVGIDAQRKVVRLLSEGQSSGDTIAVTDDDRGSDEVERLIQTAGFEPMKVGGINQSSRLEVGGDLHDLVVGPAEARSLVVGP
jgi:hypothetical protein